MTSPALLQDHGVALPHIQTRDLVGVVERGPADDGARNLHRFQDGGGG
jgi:hypothetical protein